MTADMEKAREWAMEATQALNAFLEATKDGARDGDDNLGHAAILVGYARDEEPE